ncbi:MAG: hypothetical protein CM15mP120_08930 [Pseudomonadota bacterium]|nr:MAG: hypothetical protein CM15mP120_08930 [Pseudomonadota bacterium]
MRGATITLDSVSGDPVDAVPALVRSDGAEFGLRFETGAQFKATITAFWLGRFGWYLLVTQEQLKSNDGTKRLGVEGDLFWQATP